MSHLSKTEKIDLYGLTLSEFINSPTSTEAYFVLCKKIQKAFGYSADFLYNVKKHFPEPFSAHEKTFTKLTAIKYKIFNLIQDILYNNDLTTRDYDIEKNLIIVSHCTYDSKEPDGPPIYKLSKEKLIIDLNKSAKDLRRYFNTNYSLEADAAAFKKLSKTLIKIETKLNYVSSKWTELNPDRLGHTIDTFLSALDTKECKTYNKVDDSIHCKIEKAQAMLLSILSHIIEGKGKIKQNKYFLELLYNYNSFNSEIHFHEDGAIAFETTLPSEDFFIIKEVIPYDILKVNKNDDPVMVASTFFLFKFLQLPNCVKLINKCNECGAVYISKTVRNSKYCSDKCRMGFHNKRRIESGEHAAYKRQRKESGKATPSYWGPSPNKG